MSGEAESVQGADAPQGAETQGGTYVDYLESVPEDYRSHLEPFAKQIQDNAESKFREHAEYRSQWEPYEKISYGDSEFNLNEYDPESIGQLLAFAELASDPESFKTWWNNVGQEAGFISELSQQFDPNASDDDDIDLDDDLDGVTIEDFKSVLNELLDERFAPIEQERQQQQSQQQVDEASQAIDNVMDQIKEQYGEIDEQAVYRFAYSYADSVDDPAQAIMAGFQDYQRFVGQVEQGTIEGKINAPAPPESGGGLANTNAEPVTDFSDAKRMAKERLAQIR